MYQIEDDVRASNFLPAFQALLILYTLYFFTSLDWTPYDVARHLFSPNWFVGQFFSAWPGLRFIDGLTLGLIGTGLLAFVPGVGRYALTVFTLITFSLDALHNMFGFVNAQIHLIFFLAGACFMGFSKERNLTRNPGFQFCQLTYVLVYFQSGLSKLIESGWDWGFTGGTLQIALLRQGQPLGLLLAGNQSACVILATGSLVFEIIFPFLFFWPKTRFPAMLLSIGFHLGTYLLMGILFFHLWLFPLSLIVAVIVAKWSEKRSNLIFTA